MRSRPAPPKRAHKRHSWREVEFAALDFETTGLDLQRDAVVSFGVVPIRSGRIDLSAALYEEVSPTVPLSTPSIRVHHLRPVDVAEAPRLDDVVGNLRAGLESRFLLAWSAEIEATFLARTFGGSVRRWLARTLDVLRLAIVADRMEERRLPNAGYGLEAAVAAARLPVEEAHNALNDALMTAEMFLVLAARLAPRGIETVRSFMRATRARL